MSGTRTNQEYIVELQPVIRPYVSSGVDIHSISEATSFISDLGISSANLVDIVLDVEEKYDIEIDNESMEKMITIGAAIGIIKEKLAE